MSSAAILPIPSTTMCLNLNIFYFSEDDRAKPVLGASSSAFIHFPFGIPEKNHCASLKAACPVPASWQEQRNPSRQKISQEQPDATWEKCRSDEFPTLYGFFQEQDQLEVVENPTPYKFNYWTLTLRTELCSISLHPFDALSRILAIEVAHNIVDLRMSFSTTGNHVPNFETLGELHQRAERRNVSQFLQGR